MRIFDYSAHQTQIPRKFSSSILKQNLPIKSLFALIILILLLQIPILKYPFLSSCTKSWFNFSTRQELIHRLEESVTFLPLKDLRFSNTENEGYTWFMSSFNDAMAKEKSQCIYLPSEASKGRLLCLAGRHESDGTKNSYGLAWKESLPINSELLTGLTFVSDTFYNYENLWHGLSTMLPFVGWKMKHENSEPSRWILYQQGEVKRKMGLWVKSLMKVTFDSNISIHQSNGDKEVFCLEEALVCRDTGGGMSKNERMQAYDLLRSKARKYCNVSDEDSKNVIGLTLFLRTGARSFENDSAVEEIFRQECDKVDGCQLTVSRPDNLTFCDQVKLMAGTDILVSQHGAQLTNLFLMNKKNSVMEFYPKGWLHTAGNGQYVYHWLADLSGMTHQGAWRDPEGPDCPFKPDEKEKCFLFYKNGKLHHNRTHFSQWSAAVLAQLRAQKFNEPSSNKG